MPPKRIAEAFDKRPAASRTSQIRRLGLCEIVRNNGLRSTGSTMPALHTRDSEYRRKLIDAFPLRPFTGLVSAHNECSDGMHLCRELSGKRWDEISPEVLFHGAASLPLLEPDAVIAFLPAWLLRSIEIGGQDDPILLEFTLYFLCPGNEEEGWEVTERFSLIRLFNSSQRSAVGDFLRFVLTRADYGNWRQRAEFGLTLWQPESLHQIPTAPQRGA